LIQRNGGQVNETEVIIPLQAPKPPKLEQWSPGIPYLKVGPKDLGWTWSDKWSEDKAGRMVCDNPGGEATLKFNGVAVALVGPLDQRGGCAGIFLDGKKIAVANAYIVPNTHDNALWHTYGLKPGPHTLRVVTVADADPRSKGRRIIIERAVVYRAPQPNDVK